MPETTARASVEIQAPPDQVWDALTDPAKIRTYFMGNADVTATNAFRIERDAYRFDEEGQLPRNIFIQQQAGIWPFTIGMGKMR